MSNHRISKPKSSEYKVFRVNGNRVTISHFEYYTGPQVCPDRSVSLEAARKEWSKLIRLGWYQ